MTAPQHTSRFPESGTPAFRKRTDMTQVRSESWRPQLFSASQTRLSRVLAAVRRFFDVQAGSAWRDLSSVLPGLSGTLLDVGCGAQPFRALVNSRTRYVGIDTDEAKAHFGYEMPDTLYFSGDVWPIADGSVDAVLCTETLEHVYTTRKFIGEVARVLASGGTLLLTVPFAARWHFIPYDYWRFTPSSLKFLLEEQGLEQVRVYARGNGYTVACYKCMTLVLGFLMPQRGSAVTKLLLRLAGLLLLPLFLFLAAVANLSLRGPGGDDCLGYTLFAVKSSPAPKLASAATQI